ncbi:type I DNA topoisomerase [Crenobacter luteus]|uniref:DNA topoisomerase 1 n=1 Tax=Crenobacter luteus TaxID=1452487 RepID=A0A161SKL8_9NEIS|nr:type I DNA topoisomerase [Crenobacter luteus]KZE34850.1 DNA topoisomerase I [Crenobacter luteus]
MPSSLLIVESPSKAKTLKKYLGGDFEVLASYGHVRDLVPKNGAVDPEKDFAMKYQLIAKNSKHVDAIVSAVRDAEHIYLATDPDREGEAISWHLLQILEGKKLLKGKTAQRVVFHEITKNAVLDAIGHPRDISQPLVDAQQARRALDYLVGFNLSPLLWKKIRRGLSAGRVQSPALRLICERELEIRAFESQEYWTVHLASHKGRTKFSAKLTQLGGQKLEQFDIATEAAQQDVLARLAGHPAVVGAIEKKKKTRNPAAPFTTSTLQQEAVRKLGMTTDRTMRTAQQLYEGMDVGQGTVGLITYMRTDSVALAAEAVTEIRHYIENTFDAASLPKNPVAFKNKAKNAQEAHEAIRPTSIYRTPESVKPFLTADQFKLYEMIWKRTLACQMAPAKFDTTSVDINVGDGVFRATGQVLVFAGFLAVYEEDVDDAEDEDNAKLPLLEEGETLPVDAITGEQHFTQPPPRFSEASLVKALEEFGIGRPSTYASIISTLKDREYVVLDKKRFLPTDTGEIVNKFLTEHFGQYVDYHFTAKLEDQLDDIASGGRPWVPVMDSFWKGFSKQLAEKEGISRAEITTESLDEACPKCSKPLQIKFGKRGRFIACTGYPDCDYTRNIGETAESAAADEPTVVEGRSCPECGGELHIKKGRYGKFIGCANYPKCKHIEPLEKPRDTGVACPECKTGSLIERKSRYGKLFYSCNTYPKCKYATWNPPVAEPCPKCHWPILTIKTTKRRGTEKVCPQKECGYSEVIAPPEGKEEKVAE